MQTTKLAGALLLSVAAMMVGSQSKAQKLLPELMPSETNVFHCADLLRTDSRQSYDVLRLIEPKQETTEQLVERVLRENNFPSRRAEVPAYVPQTEELDHPLTFIGMCQVAFYSNGSFYTPYGLYKFSSKNGFVREPMADLDACLNLGSAYVGHSLQGYSTIALPVLANNDGALRFHSWDTDTWKPKEGSGVRVTESFGTLASAYDPVTQQVYGFQRSVRHILNSDLVAIDYETQTTSLICETDTVARCMAFNSRGEGYILTENKSLCTFDTNTGEISYIGTLDADVAFMLQSMTFDTRTDKLYLCISSGSQIDGLTGNLFEVDTEDAHARLIGYLPEAEEYTCLQVLYTPEDDCPADLADLKMQFEGTTTKGQVSFTMPSVSVAGQALSGQMEYMVEIDDEEYTKGTADAGQAVTVDVDLESEGEHKAVVVITNSVGEGIRNVTTAFAGLDTPMVHDLLFTIDEEAGEAVVTWTADCGQNGGYIDVSNQTFRVVRYPGAVELATDLTECKYVDLLSEMMYAGYSYEVTAIVNGEAGIPVRSNVITTGKSYTVPFSESIDSEAAIENFTVVDANNDGNTWITYEIEESAGIFNYRLYYYRSVDNDADDWAILPPIHLEGGNVYSLKFYAAPVSASFDEILAVGMGENEDPATYTTIMEPTYIQGGVRDLRLITVDVVAEQEGDYRIGFHALSPKQQRAIFIDDITLTFKASLKAPEVATNVIVTPGEEGDLTATIEFDAPATDLHGDALTQITSAQIYRNGKTLVATLTDVVPGQHVVYEDLDAINGHTTYSVVINNEYGSSIGAEASAYIGEDLPTELTNLYVVDNLDGTITLHWDAPSSIGQNGGYVDTEALTYTVYRLTTEGDFLLGECEEREFVVEGLDQTQEQALSYFAVEASNELGTSAQVQTRLYVGKPYELPFSESFANGRVYHSWYYTCNDYKGGFNMYSGMSVDGDNFVTAYQPYTLGSTSSLNSGKISLVNAENPKVIFAFYNTPGRDNTLAVTVCPDGQAAVDTIFYRNFMENSDPEGWYYSAIDMDQYKDASYFLLSFVAYVNDAKFDMVIVDDVNVRDTKDYDLETSLTTQFHTTAGEALKVQSKVRNIGVMTAESYSVNLYVNDNLVQTVEGEPLICNQYAEYEFEYITKPTDLVESTVRVEVAFDKDQNLENNTAVQSGVTIATPLLNCVEDLTLEADNKTVELSWSNVSLTNSVVESFEGYDSFLIDGIGNWKVYDKDGRKNNNIIGLSYPHNNEAFAWITFDFGAAGVNLEANPQYAGHTGTQVVASQRSFYDYCDDYLISPELSGEAQTISFYARTMENYYPDKIHVRYSTTDDDYRSFTETVDICVVESEEFEYYELEIPEGAIYFALYNPTDMGGFLQVDDISYTGKPLTLVGYQVYRDGEVIATTTETSYVDVVDNAANHTYNVTALYAEGESGLSNDAYFVTGIDFISNEKNNVSRTYDLMGRQQKSNATGFSIQVKNDGTVDKVINK